MNVDQSPRQQGAVQSEYPAGDALPSAATMRWTAALVLLKTVSRSGDSEFVFAAESGEGHYQGTKRLWPKVVAAEENHLVFPERPADLVELSGGNWL